MFDNTFQHLSAFIGPGQLGLGWLSGISAMETSQAVTTDWHSHATTEMIFCLRGETHYEFRDHSAIILSAGAYLVVPANVEHRVSNAIDEPGKRLGLNLGEPPVKPSRFTVFTAADYCRFLTKLKAVALTSQACTPELKRTVLDLDRLVHLSSLSSADYGYLRTLCCAILYNAVFPSQIKTQPSVKIMDEAIRWLDQHSHERLSLDRLISFMGYSRSRFFSLFRAHTGHTPNDYLLRIRLKHAKEMLTSRPDSIRAISAACGFADCGYFSRVFKRQTGFTPQKYRSHFKSSTQSL